MAQNDNGPALDVSAVEFEVRYTCTFCKNSPATHLLVSDIVGVTATSQGLDGRYRGRYILLVCETCGIQGIADCAGVEQFKNPMLFKLAKFDVQVYPHG